MIPLDVDPARYRDILYAPTRAIGDAAYFLGYDGIIAPNARWSCNNLILFTNQIAPENLQLVESSRVTWTEWRNRLK
jgi:hypothetical protein